jgi:hypothetical protein
MIFPETRSPVLHDSIDGFKFVETSDQWNKACEPLPCFAEMYWPGYATKCISATIANHPVVIQLWKGRCPQLLGSNDAFPGGIGAEVGIYRRVATTQYSHKPKSLTPAAVVSVLKAKGPLAKAGAIGAITGPVLEDQMHGLDKTLAGFRHPLNPPKTAGDLWYPAPELATRLSWRLIHPRSSADPKNLDGGLADTFFGTPDSFRKRVTYWCNRWMDHASYKRYQSKHKTPLEYTAFILEYRINGVLQPRW